MIKIRNIIKANIENSGHFEEYFKIIDIIQANEIANPDICIESCKALIEGVSKTIIISLDNTKTPANIDDENLPKLFKQSMNLLSDNCEDIEGDFVVRFSAIIQVLGEIRNKRGDISHGRMAPKPIFSSSKLATTVKNMTENILEYVLEHYFSLDLSSGKLIYEEIEDYNNWLDENTEFPIKKAKYSQLLYENDYDEYESRYSDEFLKTDETEEEVAVEVEKEQAEEVETPEKEVVEAVEEKPKEEIKRLVNTFDEEAFWDEPTTGKVSVFAEEENLKTTELKELVTDYLFSDKKPLRDAVANAMNEKPALKDRAKVIETLTGKIIDLADELQNPTDEEE
ncbi:hypothetical protein [Flavisericum labens]|uniref:hypothetical protein n=1 Tax=Flavisericum labens TaxID=3377112 RepID=UPI00387B72AF